MNYVDILLILIVLLSVWSGWRKGFLLGMLELAGWVGSLLIGFFGYRYVASLLERIFSPGVWLLPLAFIATILLARVLISVVAGRILSATPMHAHRHAANRALGMVPGLVNGAVYATLAAALLLSVPISDGLSGQTRGSRLASRLAVQVEWLEDKLSPIFSPVVSQTLNRLTTVHPKSGETVALPFAVTDARVRPDLEAEMLRMVNKERVKEGLQPLKADPELALVARAHSWDMFARGYFAHVTPEGKKPSDRIRGARLRFKVAGENLALGQTLAICHTGLMNSPGHRANILEKSYGRLGIGILDGGRHGLMITQNFRN